MVATRNRHKVSEILQICRDWPVRWLTFEDASWPEVDEVGDTYLENALLKAEAAARATGHPAIADDSGIEVDALSGAPGPRSARFAGPSATDEQNLALLVDRLRADPSAARTARYRCVAACAFPAGDTVSAEDLCEGTLLEDPRGTGGFGYDPVFVPAGERRTMAELSPEEKHAISHRGRAFRALGRRLRLG